MEALECILVNFIEGWSIVCWIMRGWCPKVEVWGMMRGASIL